MLPLLPTTLVGSYAQPDWRIDRENLGKRFPPRVRAKELWRVAPEWLEQAQDDATSTAIRDQERAGLDIITDGEMRRESYSNRFATALDGVDIDNRPIKITVPGPFTMSQQAQDDYYKDEVALAHDYAAAVNAAIKDLFAAGADIVQVDEPYMQARAEKAKMFGVKVLDRALDGVTGTTAVHICFGYAAVIHNRPPAYSFLPEYESSKVQQISIETAQANLAGC
jgi:5-methyltetrahydropteroyltriglutamate--homocysteine methyltransferase